VREKIKKLIFTIINKHKLAFASHKISRLFYLILCNHFCFDLNLKQTVMFLFFLSFSGIWSRHGYTSCRKNKFHIK